MPCQRLLRLALVLLLLALPRVGAAQPETELPTPQQLKQRIEEMGDPAALTPAQAQLRDLRQQSLDALQAAELAREKTAQWRELAEAAPKLAQEIEAELSRPVQPEPVRAPQGATLAELEQQLAQADQELKEARAQLEQLQSEPTRRTDRLQQINAEIATLTAEIATLREQLAAAPPADVDAALLEARRLLVRATLASKEARLAELQAEAASYESRRALLPLRRDRAVRRVELAQARFLQWQEIVNSRREAAARQAALEAEAALAEAGKHPALRDVRADIEQAQRLLQTVPERLSSATNDLALRRSDLQDLNERRARILRRVAAGALDNSRFLQRELNRLSDVATMQRDLAAYARALNDTQGELAALEDLEAVSSDVERAMEAVRKEMGRRATERELEAAARLLTQRRAVVRQAIDTLHNYESTLQALVDLYGKLVATTEEMTTFIEERVFWVRSVERLIPRPQDFVAEARWLLNAQEWARASASATDLIVPALRPARRALAASETAPGAARVFVAPIAAAALLLVALAARWRLRRMSREPLPQTGRISQTRFPGTLVKLIAALGAAVPVPLALWVVSWWLAAAAAEGAVLKPLDAPAAVASGLARAAYVLLGLSLLRHLVQQGAVGGVHFRWSEAGMAHLRRHLRWFTPIAAAGAVVVQTYTQHESPADALGRSAFAATMAALAVFLFFAFGPRRPFIAEYIKKHRGGLIERSAWAWYPLLVALPVLLLVSALAGYAYTALQIERKLGDTYLFVLAVVVANSLVLRWMQLARRNLAIEAARARAAAQAEKAEKARAEQVAGAPPPAEDMPERVRDPEPQSEMDLASISVQSRRVLQALVTVVMVVGLYAVWSDVLPALRWFERVQVYPQVRYVDPDTSTDLPLAALPLVEDAPAETPAEPAAQTDPGLTGPLTQMLGQPAADAAPAAEARPITVDLADIGLAILLLMLTISASKNVPGLLEITLLPRLPLDAAGRYAVYTVARYLTVIVGVVAISSVLSVSWERAQWLAAALTFGLAFGLQEIFANFVSGLIILFEQPIRVGDTVTVGSVHGTVSRIRMRATTIIDWDNKELVIPNKTFITDQVINWTLSDPVTRIIIPVGIAYGSDTELARKLLLKIAGDSQYVLEKPEPRALFMGFGDNSLNFELRAYLGDINSILSARSDIHFRIDREFRAAGIEIAFPQRDLHVRSVDASIMRHLARREDGPQAPDKAT